MYAERAISPLYALLGVGFQSSVFRLVTLHEGRPIAQVPRRSYLLIPTRTSFNMIVYDVPSALLMPARLAPQLTHITPADLPFLSPL